MERTRLNLTHLLSIQFNIFNNLTKWWGNIRNTKHSSEKGLHWSIHETLLEGCKFKQGTTIMVHKIVVHKWYVKKLKETEKVNYWVRKVCDLYERNQENWKFAATHKKSLLPVTCLTKDLNILRQLWLWKVHWRKRTAYRRIK